MLTNGAPLSASQNVFFQANRTFTFLLEFQLRFTRASFVSIILLRLDCFMESRDDIRDQRIRFDADGLGKLFAVHIQHDAISAGHDGRAAAATTKGTRSRATSA